MGTLNSLSTTLFIKRITSFQCSPLISYLFSTVKVNYFTRYNNPTLGVSFHVLKCLNRKQMQSD